MRMPGDIVFILGGTLPVLYLSSLGIRYMKRNSTIEGSKEILFTEIANSVRPGLNHAPRIF